ncbi:MAG TPA: glycosyltransferase family 39 protein [Opitutaceae bacterium]|nr:glycosyltransferase family 39 protein [Opitutaceae bacterium]
MFGVLCIGSEWNASPTFDEPGLISAGYAYLTGDIHAPPVANLVLAEKWTALPLFFVKACSPSGREYRAGQIGRPNTYEEWISFFRRKEDPAALRTARAMITLLGIGLALVIFFWSRQLHGNIAGLFSLAFYCLSPVVIANSGLASTDIPTALFFTIAVWAYWRLLHHISAKTMLWCGLAIGGLVTTKLSGLLIMPMAVIMLGLRLLLRRPLKVSIPGRGTKEEREPSRQALFLIFPVIATAIISYLVLWAVYNFHYSFGLQTPAGSQFWAHLGGQPEGFASKLIDWSRKWRVLPEHFLIDVRLFMMTTQRRPAFLLGQYSMTGWWYFFPVAWFFKTPVSFLVATAAAIVVVGKKGCSRLIRAADGSTETATVNYYEFIPLVVMFAVYLAVMMAGNLNIGIRHLLPIYPALFILVGVLANGWRSRPFVGAILISGLIIWSIGEAWRGYPQMLAYFNPFAGGPKNGYRVLVDSSLDWGQDLPAVEKWIARYGGQVGPKAPLYFSYFGSEELDSFNLGETIILPSFIDQKRLFQYRLRPGTYLVSATMLQGVYQRLSGPWGDAYEAAYFGHWNSVYEREYQNLTGQIERLKPGSDSAIFAQLVRNGVVRRYDDLRWARLCAYLRKREPDDRVSYSILAYKLDQAQLDEALHGTPP